ncbi:MAG: hypothetical protein JHC26_09910 [Thermofilum sp.]|jgi:hypothetical protein|uniref:hypothetical protein n=1 Tax=Thermofilum sp. TaxID=1961369 RepID=UPI0025876C4B|nr:hypothetical protein [Thermofilum sp.]MCI4409397.1 hypothetical protein [Thermofilum sp.]
MTREEQRMVLIDPLRLEDDVLLALFRDISSPNQFMHTEIYPIFLVGEDMRYVFMLIVEPEEKLERGFIIRIGKHYYAFVETPEDSNEYTGYLKTDVKPLSKIRVYYADDKETLHEMLRDEGIEK